MIIANKLSKTNRAEFLLYLWQVEDIIRANKCNIDVLKENYLSQFHLPDDVMKETENWYSDLCNMVIEEGLQKRGHLQICKGVLQELEELHQNLLNSSKYPLYRQLYMKVLPYIVELRAKGEDKNQHELQTCFDALYGIMMLRLQKKEISSQTSNAQKDISAMLGQLSYYYFKDKEKPLEF